MASYTGTMRGAAAVANSFTGAARGASAVANSFTGRGRGVYGVVNSFTGRARGAYQILIGCAGELFGRYRVANDALARYELFVSFEGLPDLDEPLETFTTLPHTTTYQLVPPVTGPRAYYFLLRARNRWNVQSKNLDAWTVTIDSSGNQLDVPSAPIDITVEPYAGGKARVRARYFYTADGDDQASKFLVYLTSDGAAPDPDVDSPTEVTMAKADGIAKLDWLSGAFGDGTTIRVLVRTRRVDAGPVNVDSLNTDDVQTTADTDGPATPDPAAIFLSTEHAQAQ